MVFDAARKKVRKISLWKVFSPPSEQVTPAWPLQHELSSKPPIHPQEKSPLFNRLSPELRLQIYEHVLGDPVHFMHVFRDQGGRKRVAHYRCDDMSSPYPTWQHKCFGEEYNPETNRRRHRAVTVTGDRLLSILLSCRLVYSEGLKILYSSNIFHFRGVAGVNAMRMSVPVPQWQTIRCIHISTVFEAIGASQELPVLFPPDNIDPWTECCEALAGLSRLRYLHFDIIARNGTRDPHSRLELFIEMLFIAILRPLKAMKAKDFQVELNVDVPQSIKNSLGVTPFILHTKERPYNHFVFMERVENVLGVIS